MIKELVMQGLHTDADLILEIVAYILGPYIPYTNNPMKFNKEATRLLRKVKNSIDFMRAKIVTDETESPLHASGISLDESESTASSSPQQVSTMNNNNSKENEALNDVTDVILSNSPQQTYCYTPQPSPQSPSLSETENTSGTQLPISCESPQQTSDNEDSKFDNIHEKPLPQGEALIAHGQNSLHHPSCKSLSTSDSGPSSDDCKVIKNQLPRQATPNRSHTYNLVSQSQYTLASLSRSFVYEVM